jgi:hypothetical protein
MTVDAYPMVVLRIPLETPSVNAWHGAHWRRYRLHFNRWFIQIRARLHPRPARPDVLIQGRIISYRGRLLDYANLVGGCKPIPDVLKRLGYLKDDSPKWVTLVYAQHLAPVDQRHTLIQLWLPA